MSAASYVPDQAAAGGLQGEIARLESQAALTFDAEYRAIRAAGLDPAGTVVDLGCGTGAVLRRLRRSCPAATVIGVDVDPRLLAHAPPPALLARDGVVPLDDDSADDVLVRYVAQHLGARERDLLWREALRILRPGGRLHVVDVVDDDWGEVRPAFPGLVEVYRRIAEHQRSRGGDRFAARTVPGELDRLGFTATTTRRVLVTTADRPVSAFDVHVGPQRYVPLVTAGVLSITDLARIGQAWQRLRTSAGAYIALAVHVVTGAKPPSGTSIPEGSR